MTGNEQMDLDKDILCKGNKVFLLLLLPTDKKAGYRIKYMKQ